MSISFALEPDLSALDRKNAEEIEFFSFPEELFKSARVQDPVLGNTSILEVDFDVLKSYVQKFNDGGGFDGE